MVRNSKLGYRTFPKSLLRLSVGVGIIAFLLIGGISFYILKSWQNYANPEAQVPATQLPQLKTVTALGRIEPQGKVIKLSAAVSAEGSRIEKLLVKEGDRLKAGQVIAILNSRDRLQAELKQAQEQVKVAQANLNRTQAGAKPGEIAAQKAAIARLEAERQGDINTQAATIERFQAEVRNAQAEDERYQQLYQQGAISASQRDNKRLNLETAQKSLQEAQSQLNRTQSTSQQKIKEATATLDEIAEVPGVDIKAAIAEVNRAIAAMNLAKVNLKQAEVRSPQNGQVFEIHTHPGELILNDGIADIGQTNQMYVIAEVYESDIDKVHSGQQVRVFGDSLSIELQGIVDRKGLQVRRQNVINTDPANNIDNRVVEVHIRLDEASSRKAATLTNMQVKAVIEL
ncbi:ABC exporter membrane fusion protein [Nostoc sp. CHAB 5715]|uniref:ABC exporter membrane fusion protein n=1 Tax=Nostoc sp. CHAB 5715 TaxID=2780400 RepID=UPI001E49667F|nr:ABC exporter membrane fusion protein [Nostoc sp. CHAB 5715]MCC5621800.1 ABC exporter membrane fusion protein [Nostoc sp. CHAB 5715]